MKKIALGIVTFMFLLSLAAPIVEANASYVRLPTLSGNEQSSWHSLIWGHRSNTSTAFTEHNQRHANAGAVVQAGSRSSWTRASRHGQTTTASLTNVSVQNWREHGIW